MTYDPAGKPQALREAAKNRTAARDRVGAHIPAGLKSKPLSAFRLGLIPDLMEISIDLYIEKDLLADPSHGGISLGVEQLDQARECLADDMHNNVFAGIPSVRDEFLKLEDELIFFSDSSPSKLESLRKSLLGLCDRLRVLADRALPEAHPLKALYEFGRGLGNYMTEVHFRRPPVTVDSSPDIRPLAHLAYSIPRAMRGRSSICHSLARLGREAGKCDKLEAIERYYEAENGPGFAGGSWDVWEIERMIIDNIFAFEGELAEISYNNTKSVQELPLEKKDIEPVKPAWDEKSRELRWKDKVIKRVRRDAHNVILILNTFHECEWSQTVDDPLSPNQNVDALDRLRYAVRSLNDHTDKGTVRFFVDRTGQHICWEESPCLSIKQKRDRERDPADCPGIAGTK
jgi:hypothetical protein